MRTLRNCRMLQALVPPIDTEAVDTAAAAELFRGRFGGAADDPE